ncbi:hypothetical protein [Klebsiella quasivariicola]|uniref:Uncharacterized protein n=1 Tax=Klebsiella quasivariicola TaxID=2026240 RepID=A0A8B4TLZ4_9ENTR|nr:hypothetical protein [Klebsiella quasivariicola]SXD86830.1 Uncharacterised protein [Klebsiella quasivariicola]
MINYHKDVNTALQNDSDNYSKWMSIAMGDNDKSPMIDSAENKVLMAEGYRPVLKPNKEWEWVKPKKTPAELIAGYKKELASVSPQLFAQLVPALQYAQKNYLPILDKIVEQVGSADSNISEQYMMEQIASMATQQGAKNAIEATGGMKEQLKGPLADSSNINQTASLVRSKANAYKYLNYISKYAQNGFENVSGGD